MQYYLLLTRNMTVIITNAIPRNIAGIIQFGAIPTEVLINPAVWLIGLLVFE
jgi:hypothetical protein